MRASTFDFESGEGQRVFVREWLPEIEEIHASILIAHGAAEHGGRYERLSRVLTAEDYAVFAPDHRGHGRTAGSLERAGNAGPDGFNGMIRDLRQLAEIIRTKNPDTPIFILGHSMGAALTQRFMQLHGSILSGVISSGSPGIRPNLEQAAAITAKLAEGAAAEQVSTVFQQAFAGYNAGFEPIKSGFEWLSRDVDEVAKYVADPWCGFPFTNRLVAEMSRCALEAALSANIAQIPKSMPIYLFSGSADRVGGNGEYVEALAKRYRDAGIPDVESKQYADGRHEMLNEVNREEVHRDLLAWLKSHMA
jgi:alpha-beta hydrolase superfamily lysophospholipase